MFLNINTLANFSFGQEVTMNAKSLPLSITFDVGMLGE